MHLLARFSVRFLLVLPVLFLLGVIWYYSETLFYADDFHLLESVLWQHQSMGAGQKLKWLIQQHNEHRILIPRLLTWLDFQLEGHINWPVLMLLGNLLWCGVLYFLWSAFRSLGLPVWFFLPVPWVLFHPIYFDNLTWTISVLQQSVIVFLLSWLVQAFSRRRFGLAMFIILVATFTHGNGIFGFAIGMVFLILYREWKWLTIWMALTAIVSLVYFYGFEKGQSADFGQSLADPLRMAAYFASFVGSVTQSFGLYWRPSIVWGTLLIVVMGWFALPKLYKGLFTGQSLSYFDKMLLGNLMFLIVTALLVAISRSWMATNFLIPSRYAHYSPYITSWFYLAVLSALPRTLTVPWAVFSSACAMLICVASYLNYFTKLEYRHDWLRADKSNWANYSTFMQYAPTFQRNVAHDYPNVLRLGICRNEPTLPDRPPVRDRDSTLRLDFRQAVLVIRDPDKMHADTSLVVEQHTYHGATPFLVMLPDTGPAVWLPFYRTRNAYRKMLTGLGLRKDGITTDVLQHNLPVGRFQVGLYSESGFILTDQRIEVREDHSIRLF